MTRGALGAIKSPSLAACLVLIKHPEHGDDVNGKLLCDQIRQLVKNHPGTLCFFHDGTGMVNARIGYANAFKELDRDLMGRTTEVVCAIPAPIPRMMAYTVATIAQKPWTIFRTRVEADMHMRMRGYLVTDYGHTFEGSLNLRVLGRS
ncbi:hypothetical protein [Vitiosangium sp. GDMCC 1.1324]|uniref:hypothetical protein n=1 Tax=Vitiosangium sp. (strain GDMCC 1.1324) TaxID=2138576 RepID=UPI000D343EB5|nr:hypothetical protein [Vitiosangium sp. GDMCC 1.1324]PTL82290.1 hypothetical protein DAT35_21120 [Vitiosangium sp. GDMCC 1.1324]